MDFFRTGVDGRKFPRISFKKSIRYRTKSGEEYSDHLAHDLSQGGVRINSSVFVPVNSPVTVQIRLTDQDRVLEVEGRVAWVKYMPNAEGYQMGLEFLGDASFQRGKIGHYIGSFGK